jgi:hypothetical protein
MLSNEKEEMLFSSLVLMLHSATMQQLGKIHHPITGKPERHLEAAQDTIAILEMLKKKTTGNLNEGESQLLEQVLAEVKLNYVDEVGKPDPPAEPSATPESEKKS